MIWLVRRLRDDFTRWDRSTRIGFAVALILLVVALVSVFAAPADARLPILIGVGALLIVLQLTVLWGNRGMVSAFTQAQRLFLAGDLVAARDLLEAVRPKANARVLTLLGNTYRQLGQLDESEAVLSEAVDKAPNHYFPIYGFGRTLLAEGRYAEAVDAILRALELNAPSVVRIDLGEAYYRLNQLDAAAEALLAVPLELAEPEPYRVLMARYLLHRLGNGEPPALAVVLDGLPYWEAAVERYRGTAYGVALALDVDAMRKLGQGVDDRGGVNR